MFDFGIIGMAIFAPIAIGIGVAYAAYWVAGLFTTKGAESDIVSPKYNNYPVQVAMKGGPILKIYGTDKAAGNVIWIGPLQPYTVKHEISGGAGGGKGGDSGESGASQFTYETKFKRSFLIAICEGPAVILRAWKGKKEIPLTDFTWFEGNDNSGIRALTGEEFGDYPDLCSAFFQNYELGTSEALPNFNFEVASASGLEGKTLIYDLAGLQAMNDDLTADYALMTDLDASDTINWNGGAGWEPIGPTHATGFIGTLDGRNHTIDGLYINRTTTNEVGFFGFVGRGVVPFLPGHVSNLKLTNCDISGSTLVAMMVSWSINGSTFTDCYVEGTVNGTPGSFHAAFVARCHGDSFTRCGAKGTVTQQISTGTTAGGFYALADGFATFTDCYAQVIVNATTIPGSNTGGFGGDDDEVNIHIRCYAAASIQYSNSEYSYNTPTRPWDYAGGGFVGEPGAGSTFTSCYWDTEEGSSLYPDAAKFASGYKNARQVHRVDVSPTGGHFHVSHDGNTTGEIAWNASEATVQAAMDAALGAGEVDIEFQTDDKWDSNSYFKIHFYGPTYGYSAQTDLTFDVTALAPAIVVTSFDDVTGVAPLVDAGVTGKTTAQMQTQSTFVDWDFDKVWFMGDSGYPELRVQRLSGVDMNPADIIRDIIENTRYGAGDATIIDDISLDAAGDYWAAQDMLLSIKLDTQKPWLDWVDYILAHVGGYRFNSGGLMHFGVLQNAVAVDNIVPADFVRKDIENPPPAVDITKRPRADTFNQVRVGFVDREKDYDIDYEPAYDRVDQRKFGIRENIVKLVGIHNREQARLLAWRFLIDSMFRFNIYKFTLTFSKVLLDKGDVITLTDGELLTSARVRIMHLEEDRNGRGLTITAMDDLAVHYPDVSSYDSEGNLYTPDPPVTLANASINFREDTASNRIYLSVVPGNDSYNGALVYVSTDDTTYSLLGKYGVDGVTGGQSNSEGTTTGFIPAHPAVTWAQNESILVDVGTVTDLRTDVTDDEFWNDRYLCRIGNEIIAFKSAVETATAGIWQISNLRRGLFGTDPVAHYSGETFCTLVVDFTYAYDLANIGQTLYFKAVVYFGGNNQDVTDMSGSPVTIQGYSVRPASAALLRLSADVNDGGSGEYSGATFDLYWNLSSRSSGFGVGGFDTIPGDPSWSYPDSEALLVNGVGVLYANYTEDSELQAVVLKFEQEDGTPIGEREITVVESVTITKATDLGGYNPARIKVIPRRAYYAWEVNSILVDDGT